MGGLQIFVHNIAQRQAEYGHEVSIITHASPKNVNNYLYSIIKVTRPRGVKYLYKIYKYLSHKYIIHLQERYQFDIWQVNGGFPYGTMLADFFLAYKIPSVLRCSGDDIQVSDEFEYGVRRNNYINNLVINNYYKFNKLIAITKTVKKEYEKINISEDKIELIPNGIDYKRIKEFKSIFDIRRKHNIPHDAKIILSVGRQHPKKNYNIIPRIIKFLIDNNSNIYWIVIGDGVKSIIGDDIERNIKKHIILIDELNTNNQSSVEIPTDELVNYYKQADVFAMTSMLETFGIVLIEAMAAGLPVICFDAPGIVDVMSPECGFICPYGDIYTFQNKLLGLLFDDSDDFSRNSLHYSKSFSWDRISMMYLDVYSKIVGN